MSKILYLRNVGHSWAVRDRDILAEEHDVNDVLVTRAYYLSPAWLRDVWASEIVFCWFASFAFLPCVALARLLRKRIVIVAGGFDAANEPAINYGAFTEGRVSVALRRWLFGMASQVLCVSKSNMADTITNARVDPDRCEMIYHGFEPLDSDVAIAPWSERRNRAIVIGECKEGTFVRKGVDQLIELAESMPSYEFELMGPIFPELVDFMRDETPANLETVGFVPFRSDEFIEHLNQCRYVLQLSSYESFGAAVIDGALVGCYPIVADRASLPEVVANVGTAVPFRDLASVREILLSDQVRDCEAIAQLAERSFPLDDRRKHLLSVIAHR